MNGCIMLCCIQRQVSSDGIFYTTRAEGRTKHDKKFRKKKKILRDEKQRRYSTRPVKTGFFL